ncbi:uncharacterized protein LOC108674687 [Hyalella azteca]|uniref:Uncharacterized protein LOC108674687 n=1 Tax=Hyalella azteca TaxID=294128 RepID=A0A8B7NWP7_HYAAZ|nr:uncharacterized protein LOC108674687 [Hyalella azteca]
MTLQAKLRVAELKVLKREEETLKTLLSKYKYQLNALKVEEFTLLTQLGKAQDRERRSRNSTPNSGGAHHSDSRPPSVAARGSRLSSRASSTETPPLSEHGSVVGETPPHGSPFPEDI